MRNGKKYNIPITKLRPFETGRVDGFEITRVPNGYIYLAETDNITMTFVPNPSDIPIKELYDYRVIVWRQNND